MELMDEIKFYIKDEEEANATYTRMAGIADNAGMQNTAQILRGMAADELRHKEMLEGMYYEPELPYRESKTTEAFGLYRPFPQTNQEWENLGFDIEAKLPNIGPRYSIRDAVAIATGKKEGNAGTAKDWLIRKAGELGIT